MKKFVGLGGMLLALMFIIGCVSYPGGPTPSGSIFTSVRSPAQMLAVTIDPTAKPTKKGTASTGSFLGLFAGGDGSVDAAMKNGDITRIHHIDHEVTSFLFGLWSGDTTIVYGE